MQVKEWIKLFLLKFRAGYDDPRAYWDLRWSLRLEADGWNQSERKRYAQTISDAMSRYGCANILEIGCGRAELRILPGYLGLDFSLAALKRSGLTEFLCADVTKSIPLPDKSYDAVFSKYVLLHIPFGKIDRAVKEMSRVARKCVILFEPWSSRPEHPTPHCFVHNLPSLFKKHFDGSVVILSENQQKMQIETFSNKVARSCTSGQPVSDVLTSKAAMTAKCSHKYRRSSLNVENYVTLKVPRAYLTSLLSVLRLGPSS